MHEVDDGAVWVYAFANDYIIVIVSKDSDFYEIVDKRPYPSKRIWIRRGNCTTRVIEALLRAYAADLVALADDVNIGTVVLA